jgi:hypothetical protein
MEAMPSRAPRRKLPTGSPRVSVPGIAVNRVGYTSKCNGLMIGTSSFGSVT